METYISIYLIALVTLQSITRLILVILNEEIIQFKGLDLAAKPLASGSKGIIKPRSGSIELTTRKRLSRKSPGPELRKPLRSIPPPSNVVGPETVRYSFF